eukprot:TRINITY_DN3351_c0_g1_i5.p1 TRINITY_DN3351_c0_g1~~TRINITY_DN3351_c0_g1_i5.p1  ORF type:complete len:182 (+),score=2.69 TRINITY_DN3351_c0_g1_i5:527-1072(+)
MFGSVGNDKRCLLWDIRQHPQTPTHCIEAHRDAITCISFSTRGEFLVLTGSADHTVALWDLRFFKPKLHSFEKHSDTINQVVWSPFSECIFASCGGAGDRRVCVWDISRIGEEQSPEDVEDGPPELLFIHGGHTDRISDCAWHPNHAWMMSSVADNNVMQIWQMSSAIYTQPDIITNLDLE